MKMPMASAALDRLPGAPALSVLDETPSTNDALRAMRAGAPEFTTVATGHQTGGRGRLGRSWIAPRGESLSISVLVMPPSAVPLESHGWYPIIAGIAMVHSVRALLVHADPAGAPGVEVTLKWPNDVLVGGRGRPRKVCGILTELLTDGDGPASGSRLVIGAGLNLSIPEARLPTPTSTSLAVEGALLLGDDLADAAATVFLVELERLCTAFGRAGGDQESSGVRAEALGTLGTLGRPVRVTLPDERILRGTAVDLDPTGRIVVRSDDDGLVQAVAAGDVEHLRYE